MGQLRQRGNVWWIRYYRNGTRYEESSRSRKKGDAISLLRIREGKIAEGVPVTAKIGQLTFEEAAADLVRDYEINDLRSLKGLKIRLAKHLTPYFAGWRMADLTPAHVKAFMEYRQKQGVVAVKGPRIGKRIKDVSNAEINRELTAFKRMFSLATEDGRLLHQPHVSKLTENNTRTGFFEADQFASVLGHLPPPLRPALEFAYLTGWRTTSEILPLEWRNVNFDEGEIKIDPHASKTGEPRTFPMTAALRALLTTQHAEHLRLKKAGQIVPWVFFRLVAKRRGGEKQARRVKSYWKAWQSACIKAGCPGRIPHDLRRTAVRNLVRAGIPERVCMMMTGHKTRSVFERYNIVSGGDLKDAARKLDAVTPVRSQQTGS